MNDHNLDDLIIDNIDPKNSKTKSFLTIIALAIVVLIVAIILTKIVLKDPNESALLEEDNTELISPELTLQSITKEKKESIKAPSVKEVLTSKPKETAVVKPKTIEVTKEAKAPIKKIEESEEEKAAAKKIAQAKKEHEVKMAAQIKKQKELEAKRLAVTKAKQEAEATQAKKKEVAAKTGYFIQVGSFTQSPSARFLSVIKNSGFNHQVTSASSNGTKKLLIGPYGTRVEVDSALVRVRDRINKSAFVVKK